MIGIKIDVIKKEIYEVELTSDYKEIYAQLECGTFACIGVKTLAPRDTIYIDDEGLLREDPIGAFSIRGYPQVLSGHGLILGTGPEGDSVDYRTPIQVVKELVRFEDLYYLPKPTFQITSF